MVDKQNPKEATKERSKSRCTFLDKPGGCKKGQTCNFWHPEVVGPRAGKQDCNFWLAGSCRYEEAECAKAHDPLKKGSKAKSKKDDFTSFAESLVQVLGQTGSMEAPRNPALGMEVQNAISVLQRTFQHQQPPPPFPLAGRPTQNFQQAGSPTDPVQLIMLALQQAQAGRR